MSSQHRTRLTSKGKAVGKMVKIMTRRKRRRRRRRRRRWCGGGGGRARGGCGRGKDMRGIL